MWIPNCAANGFAEMESGRDSSSGGHCTQNCHHMVCFLKWLIRYFNSALVNCSILHRCFFQVFYSKYSKVVSVKQQKDVSFDVFCKCLTT
jgi:hypothetical protein